MSVSRHAITSRILASIQHTLSGNLQSALRVPLFKLPQIDTAYHESLDKVSSYNKDNTTQSKHDALHGLFQRLRNTESTSVDPLRLVQSRLGNLVKDISASVGVDHPMLQAIATHFFELPGKRMRPGVVLLISMASSSDGNSVLDQQAELANITELIHVASLLHDDVIDHSETRRGKPSVNVKFGDKAAILGGDFLLARASIKLARLRNCDVTELMSVAIDDLVKGEIMQMRPVPDASSNAEESLDYYLSKSYYKTASLLANSCQSTTLLNGANDTTQSAAREFGKHLGLAFQIMDDCHDVEGTVGQLGKPINVDLRQGLLTAPLIFASSNCSELVTLRLRKFSGVGDVDRALVLIRSEGGIQQAKELARTHAQMAAAAVCQLDDNRSSTRSLVHLLELVLK